MPEAHRPYAPGKYFVNRMCHLKSILFRSFGDWDRFSWVQWTAWCRNFRSPLQESSTPAPHQSSNGLLPDKRLASVSHPWCAMLTYSDVSTVRIGSVNDLTGGKEMTANGTCATDLSLVFEGIFANLFLTEYLWAISVAFCGTFHRQPDILADFISHYLKDQAFEAMQDTSMVQATGRKDLLHRSIGTTWKPPGWQCLCTRWGEMWERCVCMQVTVELTKILKSSKILNSTHSLCGMVSWCPSSFL